LIGTPRKYKAQQGRFHAWQPYEHEPALQAATNQHHHTAGTSMEILTRPDTFLGPSPMMGGKGWALTLQNKNYATKALIHTDKKR